MTERISILGTVGIPAAYGGFETLAENITDYAYRTSLPIHLSVYCSGPVGPNHYNGAELRYVNINANGVMSIFYDVVSLFSAVKRRDDVILLLGVSGAIALPVIRLISNVHIITNVDGIEWKRDKWNRLARAFLRMSEYLAVKFSHQVVADNEGIAEHLADSYAAKCRVVAYGGDHAIAVEPKDVGFALPQDYALALCRIEPENNVEMILNAFSEMPDVALLFIGNWKSSDFGRCMYSKYSEFSNLTLLDPIYDAGVLRSIRAGSSFYIHGHSAGGTNPSLVEMMHFEKPIFAFDCNFNRYTTGNGAFYFSSCAELKEMLAIPTEDEFRRVGNVMASLAIERYRWSLIGEEYFELMVGN